MEERRKYARSATDLKAQYRLEHEEDWKDCTIMDLAREGFGINLPRLSREKVGTGSTIQLKLFSPKEQKPVNAKGIVKWIKQNNGDFICGIQVILIKRAVNGKDTKGESSK